MRPTPIIAAAAIALATTAVYADDLKIALIYGKTGPLEAYAKQTETGLRMGLEYATKGTMMLDGRNIVIITKDDQGIWHGTAMKNGASVNVSVDFQGNIAEQ